MAYLWTQATRSLYLAAFVLAFQSAPSVAAELVMFESDTCSWCKKWLAEIGPVYPKTSEGSCAPLRTVDIDQSRNGGLVEVAPIIYTPTFVIAENGREVGRLVGYAGEDFFWGLLAEQLDKAGLKCAD